LKTPATITTQKTNITFAINDVTSETIILMLDTEASKQAGIEIIA